MVATAYLIKSETERWKVQITSLLSRVYDGSEKTSTHVLASSTFSFAVLSGQSGLQSCGGETGPEILTSWEISLGSGQLRANQRAYIQSTKRGYRLRKELSSKV